MAFNALAFNFFLGHQPTYPLSLTHSLFGTKCIRLAIQQVREGKTPKSTEYFDDIHRKSEDLKHIKNRQVRRPEWQRLTVC